MINFHGNNDTIVARATAQGLGAIAIIRLSGPEAISLTQSVFTGKDLSVASSHTLHFGKIMDGDKMLDEVVVSLFKNPASYTGEDVVEISCHASPFIVRRLLTIFLERGARMAEPGEFSMRAYLNGKMDLSQTEAVADLIAAESSRQHELAINQLRGSYSGDIRELRDSLIKFASLLELENDFSEEDVEFADRQELEELLQSILHKVGYFIESFSYGNIIKKGIPVALIGPPNAGKSTLLNQLLKDERAIVSDIAGTTRDVIEDTIHIDGILYRFIDTAGIRETTDVLESIGIERTHKKISEASILLYLDDVNDSAEAISSRVREIGTDKKQRLILLLNKIDKVSEEEYLRKQEKALQELLDDIEIIRISANQNQGIDILTKRLADIVQENSFHSADIVVSNVRHHQAFVKAKQNLEDALNGLVGGIPSDLLAIDIRHATLALSEILGEIQTDDLLDKIFSEFCIGK